VGRLRPGDPGWLEQPEWWDRIPARHSTEDLDEFEYALMVERTGKIICRDPADAGCDDEDVDRGITP
jgi:hypothetical protein